MQNISSELISVVGGAFMSLLGLLVAGKLKFIPIKVSLGFSDAKKESFITAEMLKTNCQERQHRLDKKLDAIFTAQTELKNMIVEISIKTEGRISRIEGQLSNGKNT